MSLLTEEQIEEILKVVSDEVNVEYPLTMKSELCAWNYKQKGVQVKVNWDLAPKEATSVDIRAYWRGAAFSLGEVFANIPRPTKSHPHAEIIAKYAEVAARRCDPWVEFEWFDSCKGEWGEFNENCYMFSFHKIRHIGDKP